MRKYPLEIIEGENAITTIASGPESHKKNYAVSQLRAYSLILTFWV